MSATIYAQLADAGQPLFIAQFNAMIFWTLVSEYHTIIVALSLKTKPAKFQELYGHFVSH